MSFEADIRNALEGTLAGITGLPSLVAWENTKVNPAPESAWLRSHIFFTSRRAASVSSSRQLRHQGIYTVSVFTKNGDGPVEADGYASTICQTFDAGDAFQSGSALVRVLRSERKEGRNDGAWYHVPIEISWYAFE